MHRERPCTRPKTLGASGQPAVGAHPFSEPVERGDESLDDIPTQILAETFRSLGFDGVGYKSSYGEKGFNGALFDLAGADLVTRCLHRVKDVSVTITQEEERYWLKKRRKLQKLDAVATASRPPVHHSTSRPRSRQTRLDRMACGVQRRHTHGSALAA